MHLVGRGGRGGWALSPLSGPDQREPQGTASASSGCAPAAEGTPPAARGLRNEGPKLRSSALRREPGRGGTGGQDQPRLLGSRVPGAFLFVQRSPGTSLPQLPATRGFDKPATSGYIQTHTNSLTKERRRPGHTPHFSRELGPSARMCTRAHTRTRTPTPHSKELRPLRTSARLCRHILKGSIQLFQPREG